MPRPNLAQDAPPTELEVGGVFYKIDWDFRTWIEILKNLRGLNPAPSSLEHVQNNIEIVKAVEIAAFGQIIPQPMEQVLNALRTFAEGYPEAPTGAGEIQQKEIYSLEWDINYIILAIRNQSGIDLSWRRKEPFHWWEFLLEFRSLCGDHYILRLMEIRGYSGKDPELKRQAQRFALPKETTAEDQAILDEFDAIFYNA